jgi:hypothetical protein
LYLDAAVQLSGKAKRGTKEGALLD